MFNSTPNQAYYQAYYYEEEEEILKKIGYKVKYNDDFIIITIGITKTNIIIRSSYYGLKLDLFNLNLLTKISFNSIDDYFSFLENIFNQKKIAIIEKKANIMKILITYHINEGDEKDLELCLKPNLNIFELYDNYMNIEKEINKLKNNYNIIKEENNKIKQENINLKNEIELMKNKHNDDIGDLQMQIVNMRNNFQQEISQLKNQNNAFIQELNNLNFIIQNNFNSMNNINNFNLMNQNNINSNNNAKISVVFAFPDGRKYYVNCKGDDLASKLIKKFKIKENLLNQNMAFLFDAQRINEKWTVSRLGIRNNSTIVVLPIPSHLIFKISGLNNIDFPFIVQFNEKEKVSEIIEFYLSNSGLNRSSIKNFIFNGNELNENLTIEEAGLINNSKIFVKIKNINLNYINVCFKCSDNNYSDNDNSINIECLKKEKIKSILNRYKYRTNNLNSHVKFTINSTLINDILTVENAGLSNNSIINVSF